VLLNGREIFPPMLDAIRCAHSTIDMATFNLGGRIGDEFVSALCERALAGTRVRLLLDRLGGLALPRSLREQMLHAGVNFKWFHPLRIAAAPKTSRNHAKILVCDSVRGFAGGVGIDDRWVGATQSNPRRDVHFEVQGSSVDDLGAAFESLWRDEYEVEVTRPRSVVRDAEVLLGSPGSSTVRVALLSGIREARESILLSTAYFVPDADIMGELAAATRRGVDIEVLLNGSWQDKPLTRVVERNLAYRMEKAGAVVWRYHLGMLHAKYLLVDGRVAYVGSANMNGRSLSQDAELLIRTTQVSVLEALGEVFSVDRRHSGRLRSSRRSGVLLPMLGAVALMPFRNHL
jgi:cardiolipin synthase